MSLFSRKTWRAINKAGQAADFWKVTKKAHNIRKGLSATDVQSLLRAIPKDARQVAVQQLGAGATGIINQRSIWTDVGVATGAGLATSAATASYFNRRRKKRR